MARRDVGHGQEWPWIRGAAAALEVAVLFVSEHDERAPDEPDGSVWVMARAALFGQVGPAQQVGTHVRFRPEVGEGIQSARDAG